MTEPERVGSAWALTRARDYECVMYVFLREPKGLTRTGFTSRVLALHTDRPHRLIVATPERKGVLYPLHPGDEVEYFFEIDGVGFAFGAMVQERVSYPLNDERTIPGIRLTYPEDVIKIQRRSYYRATAPPDRPIPVKFRERPADESEEDRLFATEYDYTGELHDVSGAGIAVLLAGPEPAEPEIDRMFTVAFRLTEHDANDIVLDTRLRGVSELKGLDGTLLHLAWVKCDENDPDTGHFATRIFKYVADRQRELFQERHDRMRRRR